MQLPCELGPTLSDLRSMKKIALFIVLTSLSACSSEHPAPTAQVQLAERTMQHVQKLPVAEQESWQMAQAHWQQAQVLVTRGDMLGARRAAELAELDARIAEAEVQLLQEKTHLSTLKTQLQQAQQLNREALQ